MGTKKIILTQAQINQLSVFGKLEKSENNENEFEFLITDGFSVKIQNTLDCLDVCRDIAIGYPYVKKWITDENKFHLILTKNEIK